MVDTTISVPTSAVFVPIDQPGTYYLLLQGVEASDSTEWVPLEPLLQRNLDLLLLLLGPAPPGIDPDEWNEP